MVKKSKLRRPKKPASNLQKMRQASGVRQSVNVVVNLADQKKRRPRATKKGAMMRLGQGEPLMPSSVTASTPARAVEIFTTNRITQDKLKEIQDEARSDVTVKLLEQERKILAIQDAGVRQQEAQENRITQAIQQGQEAFARLPAPELKPSPNIKPQRSDAGKKRGPNKPKSNISTPQTEVNRTIPTSQSAVPPRFMEQLITMIDE